MILRTQIEHFKNIPNRMNPVGMSSPSGVRLNDLVFTWPIASISSFVNRINSSTSFSLSDSWTARNSFTKTRRTDMYNFRREDQSSLDAAFRCFNLAWVLIVSFGIKWTLRRTWIFDDERLKGFVHVSRYFHREMNTTPDTPSFFVLVYVKIQ